MLTLLFDAVVVVYHFYKASLNSLKDTVKIQDYAEKLDLRCKNDDTIGGKIEIKIVI